MTVPDDTRSDGAAPPAGTPAAAKPHAPPAGTPAAAKPHGPPAGTPAAAKPHGPPAGTPAAAKPHGPPAGTPAAAKPHGPPWTEWVTSAAAAFYTWLMRPRVRLTLTGVLLLLVGGLIANNTVWTLPLVIVGALMVAVAWIGHRLEGRFAVEWGEAGTELAFKATIKPPQPTTETPALAVTAPARRIALSRASDDVIEGEAHTVEINVTELKALIAAAEAAEAPESGDASDAAEAAPAPSVRDIRIRRLADEPDRTPRPAG